MGNWELGIEELRNSQTSQLTDNFQLSVFSFQLQVLIPSIPRKKTFLLYFNNYLFLQRRKSIVLMDV